MKWQVAGTLSVHTLSYVKTIMTSHPCYNNFGSVVAQLQQQLNGLKLRNGNRNRNVDAGATNPFTNDFDHGDQHDPNIKLKVLRRWKEQMKVKLVTKKEARKVSLEARCLLLLLSPGMMMIRWTQRVLETPEMLSASKQAPSSL